MFLAECVKASDCPEPYNTCESRICTIFTTIHWKSATILIKDFKVDWKPSLKWLICNNIIYCIVFNTWKIKKNIVLWNYCGLYFSHLFHG